MTFLNELEMGDLSVKVFKMTFLNELEMGDLSVDVFKTTFLNELEMGDLSVDVFKMTFLNELEMGDLSLDVFKMTFLNVLSSFTPVKKYLRANYSKFVNKELSKAMMLRTKLRNKFLKQKSTETRSAYNKQRNVCVTILHKAKISYFGNLDIKNLTDNKKFWGTVKLLFSNKERPSDYKKLNENDLLIRNKYKIANIFNTFFVNIAPNLGIKIDEQYLSNISNISIKKY